MAMIRKQIYIDAATNKRLKAEAKRRKMSEAAIIRERLGAEPGDASVSNATLQADLDWLKDVRAELNDGPGDGWKFNREEVYAERIDKALHGRHKRPAIRQRSRRGA